MTKTGINIGIKPIKLTEKGSTKDLDALQEEINAVMYFYSTFLISNRAKRYILDRIEDVGKRTKNISWPRSKGKRKDEFLERLRGVYSNVKSYSSTTPDEQTDDLVSKMVVSRFLKDKVKNEGCVNEDMCFYWIKYIREFIKAYCPTKSLIGVYKECVKYLSENPAILQ